MEKDANNESEQKPAKPDVSALPSVESPPLSPAGSVADLADTANAPDAAGPEKAAIVTPLLAGLSQNKKAALFAASIACAIAFGALVGAFAGASLTAPLPRKDAAGIEERKAMEQSIAHLTKEISTLKASIDAASKAATTQIGKIAARIEQAPETTGSIPLPRQAPGMAEIKPARPNVLQDWTIRYSRDGYVYVEWRGELYQVMPGIPLPGLGAVESIKRQDGRLVVVTPKGLIVAQRDRDYFMR